jgi:adenylate cyclase
MLDSLLKLENHTVFTAESGEDAIKVLEKHPVQIAIIDWMMPGMSGLDLVGHIRRTRTESYIYLIMLTAISDQERVTEGLESGVDDYIVRGVNPRELLARIKIGERMVRMEGYLQNALAEQKANLDAMQIAQQEWRATVDSLSALVCLLDESCTVLRINRAAEYWGLDFAEEAVKKSQTLMELVGQVYENFAKQLLVWWPTAEKRIRNGLDCRFEAIDEKLGHHFYVHFVPTDPFAEQQDRNSFAVVSIEDITERKKLELEVNKAHEETRRLLLNILPETIVERLTTGENTIADHFEEATVLFADLVGFTQLTEVMTPTQLIDMLNAVFSAFDGLTEKHGLEKIKTIGDAYMAVGGVPHAQDDHAQRTLALAVDMYRAIAAINAQQSSKLQLRIGIHSGSVIAGIIGTHKFIYDLWGDAVNIASRMESQGVNGQIQLTASTYERLQNREGIVARGKIEVKGKGGQTTYLLDPTKRR